MRFAEIRRAHLQGVVDTCGKAYPTLRKLKVLFSQLYEYAIQNDICDKDYSAFVNIAAHKPKDAESIHAPFSEEEIHSLWENIARSEYISVILMMLYSGVRIGEICDLRKEDVHMAERWFDVKSSKTQAGIRKVPIAEKVLPLWAMWMNQPGEYVIQKPDGGKMDTNNLRAVYFVKLLSQLGMDHLPHDTRHTFVSLLVKAGVDKVLIQRIVGHKGKDVTDTVYTHFEIKQLVDAIDKI
jgi:integrase